MKHNNQITHGAIKTNSVNDLATPAATEAVEALLPKDLDVSMFPWAPVRLEFFASHQLALLPDAEPFRAFMLLTVRAWTQKPSMSLPTDDARLASLAGFGRDIHAWMGVKEEVLADWVLARDGRWYHDELARWARQSWASKQSAENFSEKQRQRAMAKASNGILKPEMQRDMPDSTSSESGEAVSITPDLNHGTTAAKPLKKSKRKSDINIDHENIEINNREKEERDQITARSKGVIGISAALTTPSSVRSNKGGFEAPEHESDSGDFKTEVAKVFEHWRKATNRLSETLDAPRFKRIHDRLREGLRIEVLCKAIDGASMDDFYQGRTLKQPMRMDTIDVILGNRDRILRLASLADHGGSSPNGLGPAAARTAQTFLTLLDQSPDNPSHGHLSVTQP
jgi:hypothetical protein